MLSTSSLLNLNVETLFEQHNVSDITLVHTKIQEVIEEKKEELRTMVGERYRDLLKAADTITAMQNSSKTLINQIDKIGGFCKNLNDEQLIGFKTEIDNVSELKWNKANSKKMNYFSTIIQVKLLTSLPELIWSNLDKEQFFAATELFIFSRHISAGLQLDADNIILQKLPVARKQWEMIKPFYSTIRIQILTVLQRPEVSVETTVDCILALLQLDRCSLEKAFITFLQLRTTAFQNSLSQEKGERVKKRIIGSLKILYDTLELILHCFLDNGLLFTRLKDQLEDRTPTAINRMSAEDMEFIDLLPEIIANFKPDFEEITLSNESRKTVIMQWMDNIDNIVNIQLKRLFDFVMDLQTVHSIKTEANSMVKASYNTILCVGNVLGFTNTLDFYALHYLRLTNLRIHELITKYWYDMGDKLYQNVTNLFIDKPSNEDQKRDENIWLDRLDDLPDSLAVALSVDIKSKHLLMRIKGYNLGIIKICTEFDQEIQNVIKEVDVLFDDQCTKIEEKQTLGESLRERAQNCLIELANRIKVFSGNLKCRKELFMLVSFCCAMLEICPNLRSCLGASEFQNQLRNTSLTVVKPWSRPDQNSQRVIETYTEVVRHLWMRIIDEIFQSCSSANYLPKSISYQLLLKNFSNWEEITLEETDSDEERKSSFRIPTQPSITLQTYLQKSIEMLNDTVPQTIPVGVLDLFNDKLLQNLYEHYCTFQQNGSEAKLFALQNMSLQIYFDITFLQNTFRLSRERKEQFNSLRNQCRDNIDPFDFELWSSHLLNNAKNVVNRYISLFGLLTPLANQTSNISAVNASVDKDPNVLSLCSSSSTSLWFPLLPVVADSAGDGDVSLMPQQKTGTTVVNAKEIPTITENQNTSGRKSDAKSKSMSFFGSMSQDWFR